MTSPQFITVLRCRERRGIVSAVSSFLADGGHTIVELSQYSDPTTDTFFMRVTFQPEGDGAFGHDRLTTGFAALAERFAMEWELHDRSVRPRVLIGVSKFGHCLYDLVHRWRAGLLPIEIVGVFSNHDDMRSFVEWNGLSYHYLPIDAVTRDAQEARLAALVEEQRADLVVLARYMQVLSPRLCRLLHLRCINIHHSFLPSFKGARPYHQAHARGVKMIGATAHYVTTDLDEGPIIAQDTRPVSHALTAEQFVALGQEVESAVLARAVGWQAEHRIISNAGKTVVFA